LHNVVNTKKALKEAKWLVNLDLGELDVVAPQCGGILAAEVGAQQVTAFAPAHTAQLVFAQGEGEGLGADLLVQVGQLDRHQRIGASGLFFGRTELQ